MAFTTQEILTAYKATYDQEPDDLGEWLATTYANRFDDLKAMVAFIRLCVEASGCSMAESLMRAIKIPGGGPSINKIVKLAQEIVACDRRFEKMTETYFRDVTDLGTLQRAARQHNGKNGKRSKTKLVTEGRLGDRPNGKSQYKSDFGSSWNFWDFGQMWRVGISQNLGEESDFAKSHLPGGYMLPP